MPLPTVVQVVVDKPLSQGFDYLWDLEKLGLPPEIGHIVEVPFGRSSLVGMVIKVSTHSDFEIDKLKTVTQVAPLAPIDKLSKRPIRKASNVKYRRVKNKILAKIFTPQG